MPDADSNRDKMRLCPTCRMEISIFATKCRHCGESVGRPRDEARKLTINDLGGTISTDYAPGEEVVDALEAFRQEELERLSEEEPVQYHWYTRKKKGEPAGNRSSSLSQLDPRSRDLVSLKAFNAPRHKQRREPVLTRKLIFGASFIAAAVLLYFGVVKVKAYIGSQAAPPKPAVVNPAKTLIDKGAAPLEVLKVAVEELERNNTPENQLTANDARRVVRDEVDKMLDSDVWSSNLLNQASEYAAKAMAIDPDGKLTRQIQEEVNQERNAYKMTLLRTDPDSGEAHLRITMPDNRTEEVMAKKNGPPIQGRFVVKSVLNSFIRMQDLLRKDKTGLPREFKLMMDGSISGV